MKVIKRDGRLQGFDRKKIAAALERSGEKKHAKRIAELVEKKMRGKKEIPTSIVREAVIKELQACKECKAHNFANFQKTIRNLSSRDDVLENRIRDLVGKTGLVEGVYGGFRITVKKNDDFDYCGVFQEILGRSRLSVNVEIREKCIVIVAR